jgi:hypothetical protein
MRLRIFSRDDFDGGGSGPHESEAAKMAKNAGYGPAGSDGDATATISICFPIRNTTLTPFGQGTSVP